jgi:hypothetical protein
VSTTRHDRRRGQRCGGAGARPDPSGWEDKPRIAHGDTAPVLSVDGVEGLLDWLLEMARAGKLIWRSCRSPR